MSDSDDDFPGIGFARGGLGAPRRQLDSSDEDQDEDVPTITKPMRYRPVSFASSSTINPLESQNINAAKSDDRNPPAPPRKLTSTPASRQTARMDSYGKGASMFAKMGYVSGQGLGVDGSGILNPIEQKLRVGRLGLGGMSERTKQSLDEARRRGEQISEDEETKQNKKNKSKSSIQKRKREAPKMVYHTMEEIQSSGLVIPKTWQNVLDLTKPESNVVDFATLTTSSSNNEIEEDLEVVEKKRLAEIARRQLEYYITEWDNLQARATWISSSKAHLGLEIENDTVEIERFQQSLAVVETLHQLTKSSALVQQQSGVEIWQDVVRELNRLEFEFHAQVERFEMDDVAVVSILPVFKKLLADWDPLTDPRYLKDDILGLYPILTCTQDRTLVDSMMAQVWLSRVRTVLLNQWTIFDATPVVTLLEEWKDILPGFIETQLTSQVIFTRLDTSIQAWKPMRDPPMHLWIFPWMPYLGSRLSSMLSKVRHKLSSTLRSWDVRLSSSTTTLIDALVPWKQVMRSELDDILSRHTYPRLAELLRLEFQINPAEQDMQPFDTVMAWRPPFRLSTFVRLLEEEFFPKWYDVLFLWLTTGPYQRTEVEEWIRFWRKVVGKDVAADDRIRKAFERGERLVHRAAELGQRVSSHLEPIRYSPSTRKQPHSRPPTAPAQPATQPTPSTAPLPSQMQESSFKDVVEDYCLENNLLFIPLRKAHEVLGHPLYRITGSASGRGGFICYFDTDIMWAKNRGVLADDQLEWEPLDFYDISTLAGE
ncbi:GC-rich sequence DNA-binding factor-like protein-domain-containing protein [Lipomyces oligophaga]|uniref:GC-rich sequence DNA-binding factor-like protein-domain-containing protein n=1 Tax=Lipomyces oligophaga TaxID=45792 RepID=UPI0034CFEFFF